MRNILMRPLRTHTLLIAFVLATSALVGFVNAREKPSYPAIDARLEPLRSAFNANTDHVRAILLASPT